ncbi:unnamed protein product [Cochlearia groenlandica]
MGIVDESSKTLYMWKHDGKIMLASVIILFFAVTLILCFHSYARGLFQRKNRRLLRRINAHLRSLSAARDTKQSSSSSSLSLLTI